jgi:hypothetical protein
LRPLLSFALAAAVVSPAPGQAAEEQPVIVHLADGTSEPIRAWTLSYEYLSWPRGGSQVMATPARKDARELWIGKKALPAAALALELEYGSRESVDEVAGVAARREVPMVARMRLLPAGGRQSEHRPEPPHRDRLLGPDAPRDLLLVPRSLDLRGETFTGTRRELCLVSYSVLVECGAEKSGRVVKVEFPARE